MPDFPDEFDADATCPACGSAGLRSFYEVRGVPAQSNLLVATRAEALAFPRGDVRLAWCGACGFVTNTAFDPSLEVAGRYEATQGCSPMFGRFARSLAAGWVGRFGLRGKAVVEIGCGDGEFLSLLCDAGAARGIGFDPAAAPGAGGGAVEVRRERYGAGSPLLADLGADFLCCRHTLEHVPDVAAFLSTLRAKVGGAAVGFEVPDAGRVLDDGAFWDVYHEHCSYFAPASLRRAFAAAGFDVAGVRAEYDGQYLVLEAGAGDGPAGGRLGAESAAITADHVDRFRSTAGEAIDRWRAFFDAASIDGRRVALWGSGSKAAGFLATLGLGGAVGCVADINPAKAGSFMAGTGQAVVSPAFLREYRPDVVIAMNPVYRDEIAGDLERLGVACKLIAL